jgi:hypothetical protein
MSRGRLRVKLDFSIFGSSDKAPSHRIQLELPLSHAPATIAEAEAALRQRPPKDDAHHRYMEEVCLWTYLHAYCLSKSRDDFRVRITLTLIPGVHLLPRVCERSSEYNHTRIECAAHLTDLTC